MQQGDQYRGVCRCDVGNIDHLGDIIRRDLGILPQVLRVVWQGTVAIAPSNLSSEDKGWSYPEIGGKGL